MSPIRAGIQPFLCTFSAEHNIWYVFGTNRWVKNFIWSLWNDLFDNFSSDTPRSPINPKKPAQATEDPLTFYMHIYGHTHRQTHTVHPTVKQHWDQKSLQHLGYLPINPPPNIVPLFLSLTLPSQDISWIDQPIIITFLVSYSGSLMFWGYGLFLSISF